MKKKGRQKERVDGTQLNGKKEDMEVGMEREGKGSKEGAERKQSKEQRESRQKLKKDTLPEL